MVGAGDQQHAAVDDATSCGPPRGQVELGVRSGWSTRVFSAAAKLVGAKMIGIDLTESCKDVYARVVGEDGGFAVTGDRCRGVTCEGPCVAIAPARVRVVPMHACSATGGALPLLLLTPYTPSLPSLPAYTPYTPSLLTLLTYTPYTPSLLILLTYTPYTPSLLTLLTYTPYIPSLLTYAPYTSSLLTYTPYTPRSRWCKKKQKANLHTTIQPIHPSASLLLHHAVGRV